LKVILINIIYSEYRIAFISLSILVTISTTIELFIKEKVSKNRNNNEKKNYFRNFLIAFSIIKNTKNLFSPKKDKHRSIHTLFFLFIIWIYVGRYYLGPLTVNLIGFKRVLNSFILKVISEKKYFWIRTPFPLGTIHLFG
jgi:hypothetical protein